MVKPESFRLPLSPSALKEPLFYERVFTPPKEGSAGYLDWRGAPYFAEPQPLYIEFCSGNGAWVIERARAAPECNWLAVEMRFDRVRKIWAKMQNLAVTNCIAVCAEALSFSERYLAPGVVQHAFVNFPDPWPKRRHARHRLIAAPFIRELERIVACEGRVTLVTDDEAYAAQMLREMERSCSFANEFGQGGWREATEAYGGSYFEELFREQGKVIRMLQFVRKEGSDGARG